jgi:hypothetical protein
MGTTVLNYTGTGPKSALYAVGTKTPGASLVIEDLTIRMESPLTSYLGMKAIDVYLDDGNGAGTSVIVRRVKSSGFNIGVYASGSYLGRGLLDRIVVEDCDISVSGPEGEPGEPVAAHHAVLTSIQQNRLDNGGSGDHNVYAIGNQHLVVEHNDLLNAPYFGVKAMTEALATTVAEPSSDQSLPQTEIHVSSTDGFAKSGQATVYTSNGNEAFTYTGTTPTSFTGCTGGAGTLTEGSNVTQQEDPITDYRLWAIEKNVIRNCGVAIVAFLHGIHHVLGSLRILGNDVDGASDPTAPGAATGAGAAVVVEALGVGTSIDHVEVGGGRLMNLCSGGVLFVVSNGCQIDQAFIRDLAVKNFSKSGPNGYNAITDDIATAPSPGIANSITIDGLRADGGDKKWGRAALGLSGFERINLLDAVEVNCGFPQLLPAPNRRQVGWSPMLGTPP